MKRSGGISQQIWARSARCWGGMWALVLAMPVLLSSGCTAYSTDSTEIGVRTRKIVDPGIEQHIYPPGATYFFAPFMSDWTTFDIKLQNLEMIGGPVRTERATDDAIQFKTTDGNDISVNVTVAWRIEPEKAPHLLERVGRSTAEIREKLIRPACRTYVRDVLNELNSEEFYVSDKRFQKAQKALEKLRTELGPEGIIIEQVLLGEHSFNVDYQKVIHERKLAEQKGERLKSEAQAAEAEATRNLEKARGGAIDANGFRAARSLYRVSGDARAVGDVPDIDLFVGQDAGRLEEIHVDGARAFVMKVALGDGSPVKLALHHGQEHGSPS